MILPGSTIGMLGGGQLGRMFTSAARTLGYNVIVFDADPKSPAGQLANQHIRAAFTDTDALHQLGQQCDVITTEFENIPASILQTLAAYCPVRPTAQAVEISQSRIKEKTFIQSCRLSPVPFAAIHTAADIETAHHITYPAILKTARLGYDGKGQATVNNTEEALAAFAELGSVDCVLEQRVDLQCEISVILARNEHREISCFPVAENIHRKGILHQTIVPARIDNTISQTARQAAASMANALEFIGVMAVEFFITRQGDLLVNEIAPRTHNSGHYTLDACVTSQFEQQVRMVCGLPCGDMRLLSPVVMVNLLGDLWPENQTPPWANVLTEPRAKLHLYGKHHARPGRKMGHFCVVDPTIEHALTTADTLFQALEAPHG